MMTNKEANVSYTLSLQFAKNPAYLPASSSLHSSDNLDDSQTYSQNKSCKKATSKRYIKSSRKKASILLESNADANRTSRKLWTAEEDRAITELVSRFGTRQWAMISNKVLEEFAISGRTGKQCRERWHNHLDPNVKKDPLTEEEEKIMFEAHRKIGNKWAEIARQLPGRTDNVVKNHFYSTLRRELRRILKEIYGEEDSEPCTVSVEYLRQLLSEHSRSVLSISNENIRSLIYPNEVPMTEKNTETPPKRYLLNCSRTKNRNRRKRGQCHIDSLLKGSSITMSDSSPIIDQKFVTEDGRIVSKQTINDADLLVFLYNSIVIFCNRLT